MLDPLRKDRGDMIIGDRIADALPVAPEADEASLPQRLKLV
jgi:hypothetical protein